MSSGSSSFCNSAGECSTNLPTLVKQEDGKPWFPILSYWFPDADDDGNPQFQPWWFRSSDELDRQLRENFEPLLLRIEEDNSSLDDWHNTTMGALAKTILVDQFPRNIYRGTAKAFAFDKLAQDVCLKGLSDRRWDALPENMRLFALTPLMHAENEELQEKSVEEFTKLKMFEEGTSTRGILMDHYETVKRFGRFPYRNKALGRTNTPEEEEYLKTAMTYGQ